MSLIEHLKSVTLESFLASHPELLETMARFSPPMPQKIENPLLVLAAESAYNEKAMSYVCSLGGKVGDKSPYPHRFLVQSQVMAAFAVEEGGFASRGFLDPHSSLREFMMSTVEQILDQDAPDVEFAAEACRKMGRIYLWQEGMPEVPDPFAAMLGAHFASEFLAARQEFPAMVLLFDRDQSEFMNSLRATKEPNFGFSAADWLLGHPAVELQHAGYAARAAEAAAWESQDPTAFWLSFRTGFEEFCRNDEAYFEGLAKALSPE